MEKEFLDELYHQLRELSVTDDIQQKEAIKGITDHLTTLTSKGDYTGLLRFLYYYGERYILPKAVQVMRMSMLEPSRIVELGSGFGWLGRGLSIALNNTPVLFVDKRQWPLTDIVADLESTNGQKRVLDELKDGDLLVMSEFIHCLGNPVEVMRKFKRWPALVIEYDAAYQPMQGSYSNQIKRYGADPLGVDHCTLDKVFSSHSRKTYPADPYTISIFKPL